MSNNTIHFHFLTKPFYFRNRSLVKQFLLKELKKEGKTIETINYIFCNDDYLLGINQQYLNHNTYTDIITFELSEKPHPLVSDIYISIDRVKENSKLYNSTFKNELLRVIFHGALHLSGYKDKTKKDSAIMRDKEAEFLDAYRKFHVKHFNK